jgi:hypothetical protein
MQPNDCASQVKEKRYAFTTAWAETQSAPFRLQEIITEKGYAGLTFRCVQEMVFTKSGCNPLGQKFYGTRTAKITYT